MELKTNSKQLLTTTKEKILDVWNVVVNYYNFLVYVFSRREELYKDFERSKEYNHTIQDTIDFISRTDYWLRRQENKTLKDYDATGFHLSEYSVTPYEKKLMDDVINSIGDVRQP